ncbi:MAG: vWA domain-containing protein [Pseudonocardiaceae bacterium]
MNSTPEFHGQVHQNLYLPSSGREVHAVIAVDAGGEPDASMPAPEAAVVLIVDCSGSMASPPEKIVKAKEAAAAAIDEMRDGVAFAVIAGSLGARMIWPPTPSLGCADARTRAEAKNALRRLRPGGGTTIGQWLRLAGKLFADWPHGIRHAILLTDGKNQHEPPGQLADALSICEGEFTCDCRGVGTDWSVPELRAIASALLGTVDIIAEPADLVNDFRTMVSRAMDKTVGEVGMRVWVPEGATVRFIKQVAPTIENLAGHRLEADPLTSIYPTGSWGFESRDYHLCIEVEPGRVGEEKLAARVRFVHTHSDGAEETLNQQFVHTEPDGTEKVFGHARVRALWTDDVALSAKIDPQVAAATGQEELANAVQEGLHAHRQQNWGRANEQLKRARELAEQAGNENVLSRLDQLYDPGTGTFQVDRMGAKHEMELDLESTQTKQVPRR